MIDKYLGFTYKDKSLSMEDGADFKGFIANSEEDLRFSNAPSFTNEYIPIPFGGKNYYIGTTKENRLIGFKIVLPEINLEKYRNLLGWLNPNERGNLIFDYNKNYAYYVKLESISDAYYTVIPGNPDKYIVEIDVEFATVNDWAAKWVGEEAKLRYQKINGSQWQSFSTGPVKHNRIDNNVEEPFVLNYESIDNPDFGEEFGAVGLKTFKVELKNNHNADNYYNIEFNKGILILWDLENDSLLCSITFQPEFQATYYSEYGIVLKQIQEDTPEEQKLIAGSNIISFKLKPSEIKEIRITIKDELNSYFQINPISRETI